MSVGDYINITALFFHHCQITRAPAIKSELMRFLEGSVKQKLSVIKRESSVSHCHPAGDIQSKGLLWDGQLDQTYEWNLIVKHIKYVSVEIFVMRLVEKWRQQMLDAKSQNALRLLYMTQLLWVTVEIQLTR